MNPRLNLSGAVLGTATINLFFFLFTFVYLICLFFLGIFVDNGTDCLNHSNGMLILPDISSKVYTYCTSLHTVMYKFQNLKLCIRLRSACYDNRDRTSVYHLIKILAPICLYDLCTEFGGDTTAKGEVTGITFFQFLANCCNCHYRNSIFLSLIYKV